MPVGPGTFGDLIDEFGKPIPELEKYSGLTLRNALAEKEGGVRLYFRDQTGDTHVLNIKQVLEPGHEDIFNITVFEWDGKRIFSF